MPIGKFLPKIDEAVFCGFAVEQQLPPTGKPVIVWEALEGRWHVAVFDAGRFFPPWRDPTTMDIATFCSRRYEITHWCDVPSRGEYVPTPPPWVEKVLEAFPEDKHNVEIEWKLDLSTVIVRIDEGDYRFEGPL